MKWTILYPIGPSETTSDFMCKNERGETKIIDLFVDGGWPNDVIPTIGMVMEIDSLSPLTYSTNEPITIHENPDLL